MPYEVLEVLEECDWEPPRLTVEERIARAVEGVFPPTVGNDSIFTINGGPK